MKKEIFVFESNLDGRHSKGTALTAYRHHGAIYGQGYGIQGNSFAIPTKEDAKVLSLTKIKGYVDSFIKFARLNSDMVFNVTRVGCGLAGYDDTDTAFLFKDAPANCILPAGWRNIKPR